MADPELSGMGTTAVALVLSPDGTATLGWVGDSRAYRFRDGALELLSSDHSVVGEMVRSGVLSPAEAESHPRRNELLRAIGPRPEVEAETRTFDHQIGDRFLLCTDGLWGPVPEAEVGVVLGFEAPDLAVRKLIGKANERGGPDNVTVQIVWVADPLAAVLPAPGPRRDAPARPRSLSLPLLAGTAAVLVALILVLVLYGLGEGPMPTGDPAPQAEAPVAELVPAATPPKPSAPPVVQKPLPAAAAKPLAAEQKAAEQKAAEAKAAEAVAAKAKLAEAKLAQAKAAEAKAAAAKAAEAEAAEAAAAGAAPEVAKTDPAGAAQPEPVAAEAPQRAEVEHFLSSWESAIANRDFALYSSLGLPGNEEFFRSNYVDKPATLALALRGFEQTAPDELVVRVQMVLERAGSDPVDEEKKLLIRQTPAGLRYYGQLE